MKTLITLAAIAVCSASAAQAAIPGWLSKITIRGTATMQDETKYKQNKPYEDHADAIEAGQNSTFSDSWGTMSARFGNREILEAMVEEGLIDSIKGWSLARVETADFEGMVAHKKNTPAVAVPSDIVDAESAESDVGVSSGKYSSRYTAKKLMLTESGTVKSINAVHSYTLGGIPLSGLDKRTLKWSDVAVNNETIRTSFKESGTITLAGGGYDDDEDAVIIEGRVSYSGGEADDVSGYLPPAPVES